MRDVDGRGRFVSFERVNRLLAHALAVRSGADLPIYDDSLPEPTRSRPG